MVAREPEACSFADVISWDRGRYTSAIAIWEAVRAVARVRDVDLNEAHFPVRGFLANARISVTTVDANDAGIALDAHARFGKGIHPAALNMGDCFAYARTRRLDAAILFKGEDFAQTDVPDATLS